MGNLGTEDEEMRIIFTVALILAASTAQATTYNVGIDGTDAIFLAGRTDLAIPPANQGWPGGLARHGGPTPEEAVETLPPFISVIAGDVVKVLDTAIGCINFFNGFATGPSDCFGPAGNSSNVSSILSAFGGVSGYIGTQGALAGVFLDDSIPNGAPPATLDPLGTDPDFTALSPGLGQVFYIGNGKNSLDIFRAFTAPTGATRLFFGITDGFSFNGPPGAYDDNDGSYRIRVGINTDPAPIPLPAAGLLLAGGLGALALLRLRRLGA
jgi:hypothetical protein